MIIMPIMDAVGSEKASVVWTTKKGGSVSALGLQYKIMAKYQIKAPSQWIVSVRLHRVKETYTSHSL